MSFRHRKGQSVNAPDTCNHHNPASTVSGSCLYDLLQTEGTSEWGDNPKKMQTFSSISNRRNAASTESGSRLYDLLQTEGGSNWGENPKKLEKSSSINPQRRLKSLLSVAGNDICSDCGAQEPKWVSLNIGAFICIKCSGAHRSLGVHITKVLSVTLDEWNDEQVDALIEIGGNNAVNLKYEAQIPESYSKPKPDSSTDKRTDFIRRKYELQQFMRKDLQLGCLLPLSPSSQCSPSSYCPLQPAHDKKQSGKDSAGCRVYSFGHAFRNSWKKQEHKPAKKSESKAGMVEFVGLIAVNIVRGTNLAVRDMVTSDPYVVLSLGDQTMKTRVIKNNLNPVWNEKLMLSIPDNVPPLKLFVYDKDKFSTDDFMGSAEIDIQPFLSAAKASEFTSVDQPQTQHIKPNIEKIPAKDAGATSEDGQVKREMTLKLQNVERGALDIELECMPLIQ